MFHPVKIDDREKEFKTLKSRIPNNFSFDGVTKATRKDYIKFNKKLSDIFELSYEANMNKSGGWNYQDLLQQDDSTKLWKAPPFEDKPSDGIDLKLYERIEGLSALGRLIMNNLLTDDALDIFEEGHDELCPTRYKYIKLQYGMQALYIKYCAKSINLAFELRKQFNSWYFDQTLDPTPQFKSQNDMIVAL